MLACAMPSAPAVAAVELVVVVAEVVVGVLAEVVAAVVVGVVVVAVVKVAAEVVVGVLAEVVVGAQARCDHLSRRRRSRITRLVRITYINDATLTIVLTVRVKCGFVATVTTAFVVSS